MSSPPDFAATFSLYSPPLPQHHPSGFSFYQAQPAPATSTAFPSAEFLSQTQASYNYVPVALSPQQLSTASSSNIIDRTIELPDILPTSTFEDIAMVCDVDTKPEPKYADGSPGQTSCRHFIIRGAEWNISRALLLINDTVLKLQRTNTSISSSSYSTMPVTQTTSGADSCSPGVSSTQTQ